MKLTHPDSAQTLDVAEDHAETFQSQGWVVPVEAPVKPKDVEKS